MNNADTKLILDSFRATYTYFVVGPDEVNAWAAHLRSVDIVDAEVAAFHWTEHQDRPPTVAQFLAVCRDELRGRRGEHEAKQRRPDELFRCFDCRDTGWVETEGGSIGTVKPCERCQPDTYARWVGGHYEPNHSCAECARRRRTA